MTGAVRLGLRLAWGGAAGGYGRLRSVMVALAATVGVLVMLSVLAIAHAEAGRPDHGLISSHGMSLLLATVVLTVGLPVLVLAATAGRLAASMRDRRLANLRLLGMTGTATRVVAAVETGAAAAVGTAAGWALFVSLRPVLVVWQPVGRHWQLAGLTPTLLGSVVVLVAVPGAVTLVSASPGRGHTANALQSARRADTHRPPWWRLVPLLIGIGLAIYVFVATKPQEASGDLVVPTLAAVVALGLGTVLVVPSLVRFVADLLVRCRDHPAAVIAGRRLQDQPAGITRLIAGLLIGLFLVTGARAVVVAFEQTAQYQAAASLQTTGQTGTRVTGRQHAAPLAAKVADVPGIRGTEVFSFLRTRCDAGHGSCLSVVVGTCDQLAALVGPLPTCREDEPAWLTRWREHRDSWSVHATSPRTSGTKSPASVTVPVPDYSLPESVGEAVDAQVFLPRSTPGLSAVLPHTAREVVAAAQPGVPIGSLSEGGPPTHGALVLHIDGRMVLFQAPDTSYYNFVAGLRQIVWAVAAVVLSVGLLAFAIGAIDRALSRRAELVSLQLTGVSPRLLRRIQWIEAAIPLGVGVILSVGLGFLAGACYLAFGTELREAPWQQSLTLAAVSSVAAVAVAGLTVIAASPGIRPELIRTE